MTGLVKLHGHLIADQWIGQVVPSAVTAKIANGGNIKAFGNGPDSEDVVHAKDDYLKSYDLNAIYVIVDFLGKK